MVLLKNENNALPLAEDEKVCVIVTSQEPALPGRRLFRRQPTKLDNVIDCIGEYPINYIGYAPGL